MKYDINLYDKWKHILFEGSNNCGKSSVISEISKQYSKYEVSHCGPPKGENKKEQIIYERNKIISEFNILKSNKYILQDRASWTGTFLFGPLYRDYDLNDINKFRNLVKKQSVGIKNTVFVILKRSLDDLIKNYDGDYLKEEDIKKDKMYYENQLPKMLKEINMPFITHEIKGNAVTNSKQIIEKLIEY
jgi:hypothetical protein